MNRVSDETFQEWSTEHPSWVREEETIWNTKRCASFAAAMGFVTGVGVLAEAADHHPDIDIRYKMVTTSLTTHSEGTLTAKDLALATAIDDLP